MARLLLSMQLTTFPPIITLAWFIFQFPPTPVGEWSAAKTLLETCVLGFLLYVVLKNQEQRWQNTLRDVNDKFTALLLQMESTMKADIELRGRVMEEMEQIRKAKFCVYDMDEATAVAKRIIALKEKV